MHETREDPPLEGELPPVDFTTLVLSLSTSALAAMGLVEDPRLGKPGAPNLPMARQTIDLLAMLEEKTRGNLSGEEERLLSQVLTDLRLRFVQVRDARREGREEPG